MYILTLAGMMYMVRSNQAWHCSKALPQLFQVMQTRVDNGANDVKHQLRLQACGFWDAASAT